MPDALMEKNFPPYLIFLLMLHRGDPPSPTLTNVDQLLMFQALHELAAGLPDAGVRKEVQGVVNRATASLAQKLINKAQSV